MAIFMCGSGAAGGRRRDGRRYADTVTACLKKITFTNGRTESPDAQPRGADVPTAGEVAAAPGRTPTPSRYASLDWGRCPC